MSQQCLAQPTPVHCGPSCSAARGQGVRPEPRSPAGSQVQASLGGAGKAVHSVRGRSAGGALPSAGPQQRPHSGSDLGGDGSFVRLVCKVWCTITHAHKPHPYLNESSFLVAAMGPRSGRTSRSTLSVWAPGPRASWAMLLRNSRRCVGGDRSISPWCIRPSTAQTGCPRLLCLQGLGALGPVFGASLKLPGMLPLSPAAYNIKGLAAGRWHGGKGRGGALLTHRP